MGQYYKAVLLNKENKKLDIVFAVESWSCGSNGAKLMEHSYLHNSMVNAALNKIKELGGARLVWAGDYANGVYENENSEIVWTPDEDEREDIKNLYGLAGEKFEWDFDKGENPAYDKSNPQISCIVNQTKRCFIDVWDIPQIGNYTVHPLPILCADGNGRGGGDYEGLNMDLVGSWKGDLITVTEDYGYKLEAAGYTKVNPVFAERCEILDMIKLSDAIKKQALSEKVITKGDLTEKPKF